MTAEGRGALSYPATPSVGTREGSDPMRRTSIALLIAFVTVCAFASPAFAQSVSGQMTLNAPPTVAAGVPFTVSGYYPQSQTPSELVLVSSDDPVDGVAVDAQPPAYLIQYLPWNANGEFSTEVTLFQPGTVTLYATVAVPDTSHPGGLPKISLQTSDPVSLSAPVEVTVEPGRYDFSDLAGYQSEERAIYYEAYQGLLPGITSTMFAPAADVTRAQFAVVLQRMLKLQVKKHRAFADVSPSTPNYDAIEAAAPFMSNYRVHGEVAFRPNQAITREDAWAAVVNAQKALGVVTSKDPGYRYAKDVLATFGITGLSLSEKQAVGYALAAGYVTGPPSAGASNKVYPTRSMTRAALAQFLQNVQGVVAALNARSSR